jgi:hypothetical protein
MKKLKRTNNPSPIDSTAIETSSVQVNVENIPTEDNNIEILTKDNRFSTAMYLDQNVDSKYFVQFIKSVERLVRGNDDYKLYLEFIRENERLNHCVIYPNITSDKACIELHHCISTLFDICCTVTRKLIHDGKNVSTFIVADEVIYLHMHNKIALVPVSVSVHEIIHKEQLLIPKKFIYGNYMEYFEEYSEHMDDFEKEKYDVVNNLTTLNNINYLLNHIKEDDDE